MKHSLTFAVCLLCLWFGSSSAQTGTYTTYVGAKAILIDHYSVTPGQDGALKTEAALGTPGSSAQQSAVTVANNHRAVSFSVSVGAAKLLAAEFNGATVKLHQNNQPDRELPTKATVVLENLLWHQFVFLLDQYDETKGGEQSFVAFLPSQAIDYPITVARQGMPEYKTTGQTMKTRRYHIVANSTLALDLWTDEARVPLLFYSAAQQLKVVREGAESLAEAALAKAPKAAEYQPPTYAVPTSFHEQEVTVGANSEWPLPATLTLPNGNGPFPAIVLVHGSGPNDRDETQMANKPFKDLASGLASQGIAVLRYDKRTRVHSEKLVKLSNFTVKDETIDDALAAVALLRRTSQIDPKRIFVLGHSLGGALVPRIGVADPANIAGFIVFAGATRPLEDEWVRQEEYLFGLDGKTTPNEQAEIDNVKRQRVRIKQLTPADASSKELLLYAPVSYWLDLRGYFPPDVAIKLKQPILILQGERDYNVTMESFGDWQRVLGKQANVSFKSYAKLDHLFLEGAGPATDADYARPRNIPKYVIDDIAAWIKKQ
ncbi:MAG TPA: alpha/beta fold hydrolase [Pyrinomonadaceae bacterium]|nr:alpha/beta fold hydrolase [Pyrinomonadaceae bacterium]